MNKKLPTEREVLKCVAEMYEASYPGSKPGENDPYLPIDVTAVAQKLGCKPQLLFGYLYYYLDHKHRYQTADNTFTHLFVKEVGNRRHCVNYPYLSGILAAHDLEHTRNSWAVLMSAAALILSSASLVAQMAAG